MVRRCSRASCRSSDRRRAYRDRRAALELVLAVGDDALTAGKAGGDDRQLAVGRTDLDRARLRHTVGVDDPDEETIRSALDGGRGNDNRVAAGREQQTRVNEFTGPQLVVLVGK